jgi:hypothetical protein
MSEDIPLQGAQGANVFENFLGIGANADDPVSLLGLSPDSVNEAAVIGALQRQLTRIGASPEALSPEADEVRLALHAAAARLLDPTTRQRFTQSSSAQSPAAPADMPVEAAMLLTMGAQGGWNRRAMQKMSMVARSYGLAPEQTVEAIRGLMSHPVAPPKPLKLPAAKPRPIGAARAPASLTPSSLGNGSLAGSMSATLPAPSFDPFAAAPEEIDPARGAVKAVLLFGGAGLVGLTAIVVLAIALFSGSKPTPVVTRPPTAPTVNNTPTTEHQLFPAQSKPTPTKATSVGTANSARIGDWNDLLRAMSGCVEGLEVDAPAAADRFDSVFADMSRRWVEAQPDGVVAGVDRVVEYLYHASAHSELGTRAVGTITEGATVLRPGEDLSASRVSGAAWSAGVLARLSRERDLPASIRHRVQEAISDLFPGSSGPSETTFKSGAVAALTLMPARLAKPGAKPDPKQVDEAWKAWLAALAALDGKQSPLFTRTSLVALEYLLTQAPEPTQDRTIFDAIGTITVALPWRKDDESRRWLLRWFDSQSVTANDLYALTSALATRSGAEGVDSSMVLSTGAGESQRAELRDRYAAVWGLSTGQTRDALVQDWAKAAREALVPPPPDPARTPVDALEHALNLARLNQAAGLLWSGDTGTVPDLLTPYKRPIPVPLPFTPASTQFDLKVNMLSNAAGTADPSWLVKYCGAGQNIPMRRELLTQMRRVPTPAEADILVKEACRGSPPQLRADARAIVVSYKDSPSIINGMLDFAPMVPITQDNAELVEQISAVNLPNIKDPSWRVAARRALVERLNEILASAGEFGRVDDLADALTAAYTPPVPKAPDSDADSAGPLTHVQKAPAVPLENAAMAVRGRWQREAELLVASGREPLNLTQIETRRSARLRLAVGRIQEFAGEVVNICELMSYVVAAEQPARSDDCASVLDELSGARRTSKHIFDQLESAERARLRLWLIRFGETLS